MKAHYLQRRPVVPAWRVVCSLSGLLLVWVAVGSPLAALDHEWLTAHMAQHVLLMSVAPPLIWLGVPVVSMQHELPGKLAAIVPALCWLAAALTLTVWHVPAVLKRAMHSPAWHLVQPASFLVAGLLFWWPIVQRWPGAHAERQWSMVLYLFLATLPCDVLAGFLVFSERVAYPVYLVTSGRPAASVLADQQLRAR